MRTSAVSFCFALALCGAWAAEGVPWLKQPEENCEPQPQNLRLDVRYTTPRGVGYDPGYTTAEGFFAPKNFWHNTWLPFMDVRAHIFDNGRFAANAGLGLRHLRWSRLWGINAYYDYRGDKRQSYNQVAGGLESLGKGWDFRINGYLPFGEKQSPFFHMRFSHFSDNSLFIHLSREFAMKGANAEAAYHLNCCKNMPFYFAGGPYYFTGAGATTWGGQLRGSVELCDRYLRIEGNTSYDHLFKWICQAQVSLNFSLGKKRERSGKDGRGCPSASAIATRAVQRVDRFEIVPLSKQRQVLQAIDPASGKPWVFWFVNNTSHSAGTYKSPFPELAEAELATAVSNAIYVFPGNDTTYNMGMGTVLENNQQLLGTSVTHEFDQHALIKFMQWLLLKKLLR